MSDFLKYLREQLLTERDMMEVLVKLLILANRPGTPQEGEAALNQAKALASRYNLDMSAAMTLAKTGSVQKQTTNTGSAHPSDILYSQLSLIAKNIPGMDTGRRDAYRGFDAFGKSCMVWTLHREITVYLVLPMNGEVEKPTHWYIVSRKPSSDYSPYTLNSEYVLAKSTNAQDVINAFRTIDYKGLAKKQEQAKIEKENAAYNAAQQITKEQQDVIDVAVKSGYKLKPAYVGSSYRELLDEPFRLLVFNDGSWSHATRQGPISSNKWKSDTKQFDKKNNGPASLDKWLKTKRKSGEAAYSVNAELNKMVKVLTEYGFSLLEKRGNQHEWINKTSGFAVTVGPSKLRGAMTKTDEVWYHVRSTFDPNNLRNLIHNVKQMIGDKYMGKNAEELESALEKLMKKAEIGFDKVVAVLKKFGFTPNEHFMSRNKMDMSKEYFLSKGEYYYAVVDPKNGAWSIQRELFIGGGRPMIDAKNGHTADDLNALLTRLQKIHGDPLNNARKENNI